MYIFSSFDRCYKLQYSKNTPVAASSIQSNTATTDLYCATINANRKGICLLLNKKKKISTGFHFYIFFYLMYLGLYIYQGELNKKILNIFFSQFIKRKCFTRVLFFYVFIAFNTSSPALVRKVRCEGFLQKEILSARMRRREESVTELTPFRNFLVHSYTCWSDRHISLYRNSRR